MDGGVRAVVMGDVVGSSLAHATPSPILPTRSQALAVPSVITPAASPVPSQDALALKAGMVGGPMVPRPIPAAPENHDELFAPKAQPFQVPALDAAQLPPHQVQFYEELGQAAEGPAQLNYMVGKHLETYRYASDGSYLNPEERPPQGIEFEAYAHPESKEPRLRVKAYRDLPAPASMGGQWDLAAFAPHYVFAPGEDAFPVRPDLDGDGDVNDDAADTMAGTRSDAYRDGVIDAKQALSGAFTVTQKGEYTVLTYSNYHATNKAAHYHDKDYSTAQVYLKANEQGELEAAFLATSWHYGVQMTPWSQVQKDAQGNPIIQVNRGSHSLQPLGLGQSIPSGGLEIWGDGTATFQNQDIGHAMRYDALQGNVKGAHQLAPKEAEVRMKTLGYGSMAADPLLPELLPPPNTATAIAQRLEQDLDKLMDEVKGSAERQQALLQVLNGAALAGAASSQAFFDGMQLALQGVPLDPITAQGRRELLEVAHLMEARGSAGSLKRAQALRLMAQEHFNPEVARCLVYAMENSSQNAKNIADALRAAGGGEGPEAEAILLVTEAIRPQEDPSFDLAIAQAKRE